jgi:hypothetical protein
MTGDGNIYRWSGEYFGFIAGDILRSMDARYLGWIEGNDVWRADGWYLGELVEGNYILRNTHRGQRASRAPRATPASPAPRTHPDNRSGRTARAGWEDALQQ